jgi:hypothetical protein
MFIGWKDQFILSWIFTKMEINEENTSCDMCPRKDGGGGDLECISNIFAYWFERPLWLKGGNGSFRCYYQKLKSIQNI